MYMHSICTLVFSDYMHFSAWVVQTTFYQVLQRDQRCKRWSKTQVKEGYIFFGGGIFYHSKVTQNQEKTKSRKSTKLKCRLKGCTDLHRNWIMSKMKSIFLFNTEYLFYENKTCYEYVFNYKYISHNYIKYVPL